MIPDVTFLLPGDLALHMDVKFPFDNYRRLVGATTDAERSQAAGAFARDVRQRVTEVARRGYVEPGTTLDIALLLIPNEAVYGFAIENDPELVDRALALGVVLCSPLTLFAVLAVVRRSIDTLALARASDEVLAGLARFRAQWERYLECSGRVERQMETLRRSFEELGSTRRRLLDRELDRIDRLRVPGAGAAPPAERLPVAVGAGETHDRG